MRPWLGCDFPECERPHRARGYCNGHLEQHRRGKEMAPLRTLPEFAWTYVVYWPNAQGENLGVLKVGRAWSPARIVEVLASGGHLIANEGDTDGTWERNALIMLRARFKPAFYEAAEATGLLFRGRGWTECFAVDREDIAEAWDLCLEGFAAGSEYGVNPASAYRGKYFPRGPLRPRVVEEEIDDDGERAPEVAVKAGPDAGGPSVPGVRHSAEGSAADCGGLVAVHGRARSPRGASCGDRDGAAFRRLPVGDEPARRDRACGVARAAAGGIRVPDDVHHGGPRVVVSAPAAARSRGVRSARNPRNYAGRFHSFKERERERGYARAGEGAGAGDRGRSGPDLGSGTHTTPACWSSGDPAGDARPAHRLQRSPQWCPRPGVRSLRYSDISAQALVRAATVREAAGGRRVLGRRDADR